MRQGEGHERAPHLRRRGAAGDPLHRRVVVASQPDGGDEAAGVADEPGVAVVAGGAGLAGQVEAADLRPGAGAGDQHLAQHLVHFRQRRLADHADLLRLLDAVVVEHLAGAGADALDAVSVHPITAVGEGVVGLGHLHRRDLHRPQRHRRIGLDRRGDPEAMRRVGDVGGADVVGQPRGDGVDRLRQRRLQGDRTQVFVLEVPRLPVADLDRLVDHRIAGLAAGVHGGEIDERLERRAGLALGLGGAVELAVGVGRAADVGADAALAVQGDQRALLHPLVRVGGDAGAHRRLRRRLQRQIEGGVDHQVLGGLMADQRQHLGVQPVGEVLGSLAGQSGRDMHRLGERRVALGGGDRAHADHGVQHHGRPLGRPVAVGGGVVAGRPLHGRRQQRRLAEGEVGRRLVEVAL